MRPVRHVFQLYTMAGDDLVWWRFLSSNGRCLARCPEPLGSVAEARAAIASAVAALDRATVVVRPVSDNRWRWTMRLDGTVVAVGSPDHDRRVRCEHAAHRFAAAAPAAAVDPIVHTFHRRAAPRRTQQASR
ncbi:hypothetical protein [Cellulomonas sp. KRMCY2]|uniref:hypothetical protein n=1 Tax=Cellulomonas sp. KRMCY2 TaxID=1304865 RepID=UPI00045EC726|nr:hypothetical protein [Cellulomonas sp. KRMCY2]